MVNKTTQTDFSAIECGTSRLGKLANFVPSRGNTGYKVKRDFNERFIDGQRS